MNWPVVLEEWPTEDLEWATEHDWLKFVRPHNRWSLGDIGPKPSWQDDREYAQLVSFHTLMDAEQRDAEARFEALSDLERTALIERDKQLSWVTFFLGIFDQYDMEDLPVVATRPFKANYFDDRAEWSRLNRVLVLTAKQLEERELSDCYVGNGGECATWLRIGAVDPEYEYSSINVRAERRIGGPLRFELIETSGLWTARRRG